MPSTPSRYDSGLWQLRFTFLFQPPCIFFSSSRLFPSPLAPPASLSESPELFLRRDPPSMICTTQKRKSAASPSPFSPFLSFQISAAFLLHPSHSDISINRASSTQLAEPLLISFLLAPLSPQKSESWHFSGALLCSPSLSSIVFLNISCLSLNTCTSCSVFRHLLSNSTKPFSCAFHLARLAIHTSSSPCLKFSENLLAVLVHCLLGDLPDGNTYIFRYFHMFLQFTDDHFHIIHCFLDISAFSWPTSRKR